MKQPTDEQLAKALQDASEKLGLPPHNYDVRAEAIRMLGLHEWSIDAYYPPPDEEYLSDDFDDLPDYDQQNRN